MDEHERLTSTAQIAEYLGVPVGTLHQWRHKGTGPPGYKVGRHIKYRLSEVDAWLEGQADKEKTR